MELVWNQIHLNPGSCQSMNKIRTEGFMMNKNLTKYSKKAFKSYQNYSLLYSDGFGQFSPTFTQGGCQSTSGEGSQFEDSPSSTAVVVEPVGGAIRVTYQRTQGNLEVETGQKVIKELKSQLEVKKFFKTSRTNNENFHYLTTFTFQKTQICWKKKQKISTENLKLCTNFFILIKLLNSFHNT